MGHPYHCYDDLSQHVGAHLTGFCFAIHIPVYVKVLACENVLCNTLGRSCIAAI
ncbi:uncharacterized protein LAESUDRAFT_728079 [Laetiporus sulphureus 93-53]|uniref:Uncharacterized protein n=1 Tax=Laetiporus sulphureus 93-53 TaxID=1314785 RepID=A0A165D7F8_9APHY|nr:uncharacterized protein LAESUDRAFT_728079 [Laetiporus sulphureus 93-53]KZT04276.1 hypothetical protein LAESUDRAFT_728079 [Laetiporus sulphureus 93-53]